MEGVILLTDWLANPRVINNNNNVDNNNDDDNDDDNDNSFIIGVLIDVIASNANITIVANIISVIISSSSSSSSIVPAMWKDLWDWIQNANQLPAVKKLALSLIEFVISPILIQILK
jgi:hypothetical protein